MQTLLPSDLPTARTAAVKTLWTNIAATDLANNAVLPQLVLLPSNPYSNNSYKCYNVAVYIHPIIRPGILICTYMVGIAAVSDQALPENFPVRISQRPTLSHAHIYYLRKLHVPKLLPDSVRGKA